MSHDNNSCHSRVSSDGTMKEEESNREREHFESVCSTYRQYGRFAMAQRRGEDSRFLALSQDQHSLLPSALQIGTPDYHQRQNDFKEAAIRNQFFFDLVLRHHGQPHSQQQDAADALAAGGGGGGTTTSASSKLATDADAAKLTSVLKSLVRDWSTEGRLERQQAYGPILDDVRTYLPRGTTPKKICVPGSGVGRLAFDLYCSGYEVQGNDFSLYMLLASDYMLNNGGQISPDERPIQISPYLLESRNSHSFRDRVRSIEIPDVDPVQRIEKCFGSVSPPEFSVAAGDFVAIYSHPKETAQWDCVVSCFFLDACPNIIETLNVIGKMLIPGGLLVNLGPLHFHWQGPVTRPDDKTIEEYRRRYSHLDDRYLSSIDMSWDDIRQVLINMGYEILKEEAGIECQYTADQRSMMRTTYNCVNFVARKIPTVDQS